jgi:hypothetical protein
MDDFPKLILEYLDCSRKLCFYFYNLSDWKGVDVARMLGLATRDQVDGDHPTRFL